MRIKLKEVKIYFEWGVYTRKNKFNSVMGALYFQLKNQVFFIINFQYKNKY